LINTLVATSRSCDAFKPANPHFCNFLLMSSCACPTMIKVALIICWFSGASGLKGDYRQNASHSLS
jgi:hypothetical protein